MKIEIENYDSMTPEEKLAALEANYASVAQHKAAADKAASEAASYKKQLREKQTDEEAKAAQEAADRAALIERVEKAEHELKVSNYVKSYLAMGYDEKLAESSAEAMAKGDTATVFANQKIHAENREKTLKAEWLKGTPRPTGGNDPKIDYTKKIEEAQASGDFTAVAYYTRLSAQEASANDE